MSESYIESDDLNSHYSLWYFPFVNPEPLEMSGLNIPAWPCCVMALKEELRVSVYFPRTLEEEWCSLRPLWVWGITEGLLKEM